MKKFFVFFLFVPILATILFQGCEQTIEQEDFPYFRRLVVRGIIQDGQVIKDIYIGRTLPVGVDYQKSFADVKDAIVVIQVNNDTMITLRHTANGLYSTSNLVAQSGNTYTLSVRSEDLSCQAKTFVPKAPNINRVTLTPAVDTLGNAVKKITIEVSGTEKIALGATWATILSNGNISSECSAFGPISSLSSGSASVESFDFPKALNTNTDLAYRVYAYDYAFFSYAQTAGSSKLSDAVFGKTGQSVIWNVEGAGIGLFLGRIIISRNIN